MRKDASQNKFRWEPPTKNGGDNKELSASSPVLEPSSIDDSAAPVAIPAENGEEAVAGQAALAVTEEKVEPAPKNPASASVTSLAKMIRNEISIEELNDAKKVEEEASQDKAPEILPEELAKLRERVATESDGDKNLSSALMARKLDRAFKKEDGEGGESETTEEGEEKVFDSSRAPQTENVLKKSVGERVHAFFLQHPAVSASVCLAVILVPFGIFGLGQAPKAIKKPAEESAKVTTPVNMNAKQLIAHSKANYAKNNKLTALNDLFAAVKLAPKDATVYVARGDYYFNEKKLASAADDYKKALQLNPRVERAQKQLALCRSSLAASAAVRTKPEKGPAISKTVLDEIAATTDFDALRVKAFSALQSGKFDYAVVALSRCAQLRPNDALTRRYLAFALLSNGELSLAIKQFHAWSRVDSASLSDKLKFGRALAAAEGVEGNETTRQFFNSLVNDHSSEPDALLRIATTCYDLGFYDEPTAKAIQIGLRTASNETSEQFTALDSKIKEKQNAATQESAFKPLVKD